MTPADDLAQPQAAPTFHPEALAGRVVLVTGGDRGIGAAIATVAARAGADVAIGYHTGHAEAAQTAERIRALGRDCDAHQADVSAPERARALVSWAEERFGRVDGLVNNAGIMPSSPFLEITDDEWDLVLRTDLYAMFHCTQAVLPGMLRRGCGSVVSLASRLGQVGWAGVTHYTAAKAGVIALTKSLAKEFGQQGIRFNAVSPGVTNTRMGQGVMAGETGAKRRAELPLGRFAEPEEVADAVIFLLSDASSLFLGQTLNPNCGGYMP